MTGRGLKGREDCENGGGGAIILSISVNGGRLFKGRLLFKEIRYLIIHSPQGFSGIIYNTGWGTSPDWLRCSLQVTKGMSNDAPYQRGGGGGGARTKRGGGGGGGLRISSDGDGRMGAKTKT